VDWTGDFASAQDRLVDIAFTTTPSQRLKWLEQVLTFAVTMKERGETPTRDIPVD
jgi:hypothetical protein